MVELGENNFMSEEMRDNVTKKTDGLVCYLTSFFYMKGFEIVYEVSRKI